MMSLQELGNIELILGKGERSIAMAFNGYNIEEKKYSIYLKVLSHGTVIMELFMKLN